MSPEQFTREVERELPNLQRRAREMTQDWHSGADRPDDADDLVQDTLERAWRGLHTLDGEDPISNWLRRVMVNARNDWGRMEQRSPSPSLYDHGDLTDLVDVGLPDSYRPGKRNRATVVAPDPTPEEGVTVNLDGLSAQQREAIALSMQGRTRAQIADELGLPEGTVAARVHRANKKLKESAA